MVKSLKSSQYFDCLFLMQGIILFPQKSTTHKDDHILNIDQYNQSRIFHHKIEVDFSN